MLTLAVVGNTSHTASSGEKTLVNHSYPQSVHTKSYISDVQTSKEEPGLYPVLLGPHPYQVSMGRMSAVSHRQ